MSNLIEVNGLCKTYPGFALDHLSFTMPGGSIMGFVGQNGAGKSTTIKLILNEIRRDAGDVKVFGLDNSKDDRKIKEQIGVVLDECCYHEIFKVPQISKILAGVYSSWDKKLFADYCGRFRLPEDKQIKGFSRGMKMKLSIAAALSHRPKLLILDEATSGLDPVVRDEILEIFQEFIQDESNGVFFSSHITEDLQKIADYITFIHKGKLVLSKTKDELVYGYGIVKCGLKEFEQLDKSDLLAWRRSGFQAEALVADKNRAQAKYKGMVVDSVTIDDVILLYAKSEKEVRA